VRIRVLVALVIVTFSLSGTFARADSEETTRAPTPAEREASPRHAPRAYSLTLGYAYTPKNALPLSAIEDTYRPMGLAVELRYGWQVGGLDGSAPAWIGFGTSFFAHTRGSPRTSLGVDYGLFVRHAVFPGPRVRAFFGYGLGAAQVFVRGVDGRGIGHLTALSLGVDVRVAEERHVTLELSYRFVILPSFETATSRPDRYDFHAIRLSAGIFLGR
jgi:hypothetical protein